MGGNVRNATARLANSRHFAEALIGIGDISQPEGDRHNLKMIVLKRQRLRVRFDKRDLAIQTGLLPLLIPDFEHFVAEIGCHYRRLAPSLSLKRKGQVACPRADVENRPIPAWLGESHGSPPPVAVDVHRQQMIHAIIARRNLPKHSLYALSGLIDDHSWSSMNEELRGRPATKTYREAGLSLTCSRNFCMGLVASFSSHPGSRIPLLLRFSLAEPKVTMSAQISSALRRPL